MSTEKRAPVAELHQVSFTYPGSQPALENVDLAIEPCDFLGLVGPNGGGKTTLLKILLGLIAPDAGRVVVLGGSPMAARPRVGYVPQHASIDVSVPSEVLDVVLMGRLWRSSWGARFASQHVDAARQALARTGAEDLAQRRFGELSGGQRQRVLIARALAAEAELLLLDEPTAGVDLHREKELLALLHELNRKLTIVLVSHDLTLVSAHLERAAWVNRSVTTYRASDLTAEMVESIYHGSHEPHDDGQRVTT